MSLLISCLMLLQPAQDARKPTLQVDKAFEGKWVLVSCHHGEAVATDRTERRMTVQSGAWTEWRGGDRWSIQIQRESAKPWPTLTRAMSFDPPKTGPRGSGVGGSQMVFLQRGIYRIQGDTLTLALVPVDVPQPPPLPENFERREGVTIEVWRRDSKP